jgi:hypothetical protein
MQFLSITIFSISYKLYLPQTNVFLNGYYFMGFGRREIEIAEQGWDEIYFCFKSCSCIKPMFLSIVIIVESG